MKKFLDLLGFDAEKKSEKPKWDVSVVAIVVSLLFVVYFFVPVSLF